MSNLIGIPSADYYETRLANMWNGTNGTVYVEKVPEGSMPISEYSYIVVNPGEVNMQVAKIDGWDSDNDTFNVIDVAIPSGAGTYYNAKNHPVGSVVRFSNNYAFWKDIQEAINGKLDISSLAPVAVSNDYNDLDNKPTIPTDNCQLCNGCGYITGISCTDVTDALGYTPYDNTNPDGYTTCTGTLTSSDLACYTQFCDLPDVSGFVEESCIACINGCCLTEGGDITIQGAGGDMEACVYDPNNCATDAFDYCNMYNTPTIPTDNCQLANSCGFTTCTGTLTACDIANLAQCCDIPTNNCELSNGCGYTTCTGTVVAGDLTPYAKCCELGTVAFSNKYCDLSGQPTIPTDNCQLGNSCGYTTCTGTLSTCSDITTALGYTPYSNANPNGYTTCTGTLVASDIQCLAQCCDIPTDNNQLANGCGYQTTSCMVCDFSTPNNTTYPTTEAVCCYVGQKISGAYIYKGTVADYDSLPTTGLTAGDVYNVTTAHTTAPEFPAGANVSWTGSDWDVIGGMVDLSGKQDVLTAGNNISLVGNVISGDFNYAEPTTAAACTTKCVCIPEITQLCAGQTIIVKPTITATNCATNIKLNGFDAYPVRYNNAALTSTTDGYVRGANQLAQFVFDGSYWHVVGKSYDANTTYTMNYQVDAGKHKAGSGSYAISRYSLVMQKDDGTWETLKDTSTNYSTATTKTVNTHGFRLGEIRYYNTTTVVANGALIAANTLNSKAASVDMRYSTNCGGTTDWDEGDYIYIVGTIGNDGLFYLDSTKWWSNALPTTKDNKVYIRLGIALAAAGYTASLLEDNPVYYYDNGIKVYVQADNKQDKSNMVTTLTGADNDHYPTAKAVADAIQGAGAGDMLASTYDPCNCNTDAFDYCNMYNTPTIPDVSNLAQCCDIPTDNCQLGNSCGYTTCTGTVSSCSDIISKLGYTPYSSANPNGYTSCTGTVVASDLTPYAKNCDLKAVATSGKYCDLTGTPTIPTNNNQLTNGCGYTTCTGTLVASDLTGYAKSCDLKAVATSGKYCDLTGTPTIPTDNCQLANGCGFTTCTGTLTSSDISGLVAESCIACINGCCLTAGGNVCIDSGGGGTVMCETSYDPGDYKQDFLYFTY